jgi:hypothetical protein
LYDENGETVSYEEAPKVVKSKYDWLELKRQGQQEIKFSK